MRCLSPLFAALSVLLLSTGASPAQAAKPSRTRQPQPGAGAKPRVPLQMVCRVPANASASARGKYTGLIRRIHVPADCSGYGGYRDWGYYPATSYGGARNLPAAYWVYVYPHWYVWRSKTQQQPPAPVVTPPPAVMPPARNCTPSPQVSPDASGRYRSLVRRLYVPRDCATYGAYRDYGHYPATSYAGARNLPAGYWVYVYPNWYLWRHRGP